IWSETIEKITEEMKKQMRQQGEEKYSPGKARFNSVYFMAESGARGNIDQVKQLSAIRGLMSRPQRKISGEVGEIIETPVLSNFREGLSILEYFISTHGGRKGLSDTALKTSEAGYLTRRLIDVAHHVVVTEEDCKTINRIKVSALKVGDDVIESLKERIVGRIAADNISYDIEEAPGKIVTKTIKAGEMITEQQAEEIMKSGIYESIPIRSVLTCESKNGVCAKCYGMDLSTGELVKVGEAVGIVAAQSIGEPGTQLTLRTFHIGGAAATLAKKSSIRAPFDGKIEYRSSRILKEKKFEMITKYDEENRKVHIVISSDASIRITGKNNKQDWQLPYGSRIYVEDGEEVKKDQLIADWDAYSIPVVATKSGKIKYSGLEEGKTYVVEHRTSGIKEIRVLPSRGNPKLNIINEKDEEEILASYNLPADSIILVENGETVKLGDVIAKIPREEIKTKDITAGLPRIEELFEARHPQNSAILSEIDGVVHIKSVQYKGEKEGKEETDVIISVINEKTKHHFEYKIPPGRFPLVHEGDNVEAGEPLTDGIIDPHKYLAIRGSQHLQEFLLNEIQGVYRLQGVSINDKHIEIIIKQMLSFVRIVDPGVVPDNKSKKFYEFIYGEIVPKKVFKEEIKKYEEVIEELKKQKKYNELKNIRVPKAEPILLGITSVASASESFLSAASFQETSRILTQAAIECKLDTLSGLKENVIIGHLIPCGTGFYGEETIGLRKEEKIIEKLEV
ncbi:MAG: DNA-directed RNA polymerase subunit beta', partial [candidate division WOR-3 bacterium]